MDDPRNEDRIEFFVEEIEDHAADHQTCDKQKCNSGMEPTDHHGHMVQGEHQRTEDVSKSAGG